VVSVTDPYGRILGFLDRGRYFLSSSSSVVLKRLSGPRSRPSNFFFTVVPGIEPGPPDLWLRALTTRPQKRSEYSQNQIQTTFTLEYCRGSAPGCHVFSSAEHMHYRERESRME
jgi:hypothetical protein